MGHDDDGSGGGKGGRVHAHVNLLTAACVAHHTHTRAAALHTSTRCADPLAATAFQRGADAAQ